MANLNDNKCPKCFSSLGQWRDDPILTQNGSKFVYDEESGLLIPEIDILKRKYKGFYQIKAEVIEELQEIRKQQEIDTGISEENRTEFSKVKSDPKGYWIINKKHIKQLRESTEKILEITGQTKEQYFNYDEEGIERQNPHQLDWIDLGLTNRNWKGYLKDQHIEDLRKFLISYEKIWCNYLSDYWQPYNYNNIYELKEFEETLIKTNIETPHPLDIHNYAYQTFAYLTPRSALTNNAFWSAGLLSGNRCIFKFGRQGGDLCVLQKYIKFTDIESNPLYYWFTGNFIHIFSDNNYIYCCGTIGTGNLGFVKLDKDCNIIQYQYYNVGFNPEYLQSMITMDNQYFYLMTAQLAGIGKIDYKIRKYSKIDFSYISEHIIFNSDIAGFFWDLSPSFGWGYQITVDDTYIYILQSLFQNGSSDSWLKLYRYNKNTMTLIDNTTLLTRFDSGYDGFEIHALGQDKEFLFFNVPTVAGLGEWNKYLKKSDMTIVGDIPLPTWDVYSPVVMNFCSDWERRIRAI